MTHDELVDTAAKWLQRKCPIVITEMATIGESPDAIGWNGSSSTLIECKASRSDFLADKKKIFRRNEWQGIGRKRYFMAPAGLIAVDELPENWGLLEVHGARIKEARKSGVFPEVNTSHEIDILISALRRIGHNAPSGVSIKCYNYQTNNRATLGVAEEEMA